MYNLIIEKTWFRLGQDNYTEKYFPMTNSDGVKCHDCSRAFTINLFLNLI